MSLIRNPIWLGRMNKASTSSVPALPSIAGLRGHWDAYQITGKNNGDILTQWDDLSGNGFHWTNITGTREPLYATNQLNGLPSVRFSGKEFNGNAGLFTGMTAGEIFCLTKVDADPAIGAAWGHWQMPRGSDNTAWPFSDGLIYEDFLSTTRQIWNPTPNLAAWHTYSIISTSSEWTASFDGTSSFTTGTNTVNTTGAVKLGVSWSNTNWMDGYFSEIVFYDHKLSAPDRALLVAYILAKYGI